MPRENESPFLFDETNAFVLGENAASFASIEHAAGCGIAMDVRIWLRDILRVDDGAQLVHLRNTIIPAVRDAINRSDRPCVLFTYDRGKLTVITTTDIDEAARVECADVSRHNFGVIPAGTVGMLREGGYRAARH